jgi:hypothetical protein
MDTVVAGASVSGNRGTKQIALKNKASKGEFGPNGGRSIISTENREEVSGALRTGKKYQEH